MIAIDLPWPSRKLSANSRLHWADKARAVKRAREDATFAAISAGARNLPATKLHVTAIFYPPSARRFDLDGLITRMKAAFDGIADATGVDDHHWSIAARREAPVKNGNVRVEIEVVNEH